MKTMPPAEKTAKLPKLVGVIGLGLMGRDIAACLLAHDVAVCGFDTDGEQAKGARPHIEKTLAEMLRRKLVKREVKAGWNTRFMLADSLTGLKGCDFVIEATPESLLGKQRIFKEVEAVVSKRTILASNTSSFPIGLLQKACQYPQRLIGMHWAEPAQIMRYLEITPGDATSAHTVKLTKALGEHCGKEPTVLKQDIRGFLSNRMMYAMLREAFHLVEAGIADVETVDQSFRNDIGWWATFAGPFRWMDLTGIPAYAAVMEGLLPELSRSTELPELMKQTVKRGARGMANSKGFYKYTPAQSKKWEEAWVEFTYDVKKLAEKYEEGRI